jgi:glycosyltransferase involved in cell wall biosynthesis
MQSNPKVSIVIPCYNRERYLGLAVQSVLNQTYTHFELIIVDDGSTDASLQIAEQFASEDSRVKVIVQEHNQGQAHALKKGFDTAQGEFIGQVDSDDLLEPQALELTVQALEGDPGLGVIYTNYIDMDEDGNKVRVGMRCSIPYSAERLLTKMMVFHFTLMRKSVYLSVGGFNPKFDPVQDYDLLLRLSEVTRISRIPEFLYLHRIHPGMVTQSKSLRMLILSYKAVEQALARRGMEDTHQICVSNPQIEIVETYGVEYFRSKHMQT